MRHHSFYRVKERTRAIIQAVRSGWTYREVSAVFGIDISNISKLMKREMERNMLKRAVLSIAVLLFLGGTAKAQSTLPPATAHGVELTWGASTSGSNPLAGYNVWRCTGTCLATGTGWTQLNTAPVSPTTYLDPAAGLSTSTTYSYVVYAQDTKGELSGPSNVATVSIPATFPSNATIPSSPAATVQ